MRSHFHTLILIGLLAVLVGFGLAACQQIDNSVQAASEPAAVAANTIVGADRNFVLQAEKGSIQERVLGRMAEERSQNSGIKEYGKMLVQDHNAALQKLVDLMNKDGMPQPKNLPEERTEAINKLQDLSGEAFDREFVNMMVQDHQQAVSTYRREEDTAQNSDVRNFAKDFLPTLEKHLKEAQDLQNKMETGR